MPPVRHIASWVLQVLVAAIMGLAAYDKFTGAPDTIAVFEVLGMEPEGRFLIGTLEGAVAFAMLLPFTAPWGAVLGWGVMTGALIGHATDLGFTGDAAPMAGAAAGTWLACTAIIALRHDQVPLVRLMFGRESVDPSHGG